MILYVVNERSEKDDIIKKKKIWILIMVLIYILWINRMYWVGLVFIIVLVNIIVYIVK